MAAKDERAELRLRNAELIAKNEALQEEMKALRESNKMLCERNEEMKNASGSHNTAGRAGLSKRMRLEDAFSFPGMPPNWASSSPALDPSLPKSAGL